jgi:hypothetical protein
MMLIPRGLALRWAQLSADWLDVKAGESDTKGKILVGTD